MLTSPVRITTRPLWGGALAHGSIATPIALLLHLLILLQDRAISLRHLRPRVTSVTQQAQGALLTAWFGATVTGWRLSGVQRLGCGAVISEPVLNLNFWCKPQRARS